MRNDILSPTVRKNCSSDEITRTIYLNSARSEQFLATECFFNFRKIIIQIGKIQKHPGKVRKVSFLCSVSSIDTEKRVDYVKNGHSQFSLIWVEIDRIGCAI